MAKAQKISRTRVVIGDGFAELVVWQLPAPLPGSAHPYKYRLAYIVRGVCRVRYDNERGKGDHRHIDDRERPYKFKDLERLLVDFWRDVSKRR